MMKLRLLPAVAVALICGAAADSSRTSVDWEGVYRGVLPCADCEGIETEIAIGGDGRYAMRTRRLGREKVSRDFEGTFSWNAAGGVITLAGAAGVPAQYRVGENVLIPIDADDKRVAGALSSAPRLEKVPVEIDRGAAPLADTRWRLAELDGRAFAAAADPSRSPWLMLSADGAASGFGGCNSFTGRFDLPAPTRIRFASMARTLMACASGMETEEAFLKALERADNYAINGNRLALHRARMAPLARFEALAR